MGSEETIIRAPGGNQALTLNVNGLVDVRREPRSTSPVGVLPIIVPA